MPCTQTPDGLVYHTAVWKLSAAVSKSQANTSLRLIKY